VAKPGIQIGATPDSGFDDPLGMLKDCHRRIEHFLDLLAQMEARGRGRRLSPEETAAVQAALHYFRLGGVRHTADEEESLFPRMRELAGDELKEVEELEKEHRDAERLHAAVETAYEKWLESGALHDEDAQQLHADLERLKAIYGEHIQVEEQIVFPRAAKLLRSDAIAAMGAEFRERRSAGEA
jgi:hemerythrin-like domain-containing protein